MRGIRPALGRDRIRHILEQDKSRIDLVLLCVDRDGDPGRREALDRLERQAAEVLGKGTQFLAENAWQEIEVWGLAGHPNLPKEWSWSDIREASNPKEPYFLPFAKQCRLPDEPGKGRKTLSLEAARHYNRIRQ